MSAVESRLPVCPYCGNPFPAGESAHGICARCAWTILEEEGDEPGKGDLMSLPGLRVVAEIARGGMGVVYRAVEAEAGRDVAVKMMQPALADSAEVRERFGQEARAMGALDHPGILPVYRVGAHHGLPFFTMKLAEQGALSHHLARYANDWRGIATLMAGIAEAVHYAHQRGLLHRDLKPGNILFDAAGHAYVSDFGLVKLTGEDSSLTRSVSVLGTPHYMAPEVAERDARAASVASDVWSLGTILYELMAQRLAFQAEGVPALLRRIVEEDPAPLPASAPRDLATVALRCLHKTPAQRYTSAGALADDLRRWLRGEPVTARRLSATERTLRWCRRRPALAGMSALLVLSFACGGALVVAKNRALSRTLRTSLFNEARAVSLAARVQNRDDGLFAVQKAARLGSSPELEEEAASLLALPSMKLIEKTRVGGAWTKLIPDANLVNAADFTHEDGVRIVELSPRRELAVLPPGRAYNSSHDCFSDDGRLLLYMRPGERKLVVGEWSTGRILKEIEWQNRWSALFTPDSKALIYGRQDGRVERLDLFDDAASPTSWPAVGLTPAKPLAFSPDGRWLAVTGNTHEVRILDAQTGTVRHIFGLAGDGEFRSGCWSGDSQSMMIGSRRGVLRSWSLDGGPSRLLPGSVTEISSVAIQPQGQFAISCPYEGRWWILDWPSGHTLSLETGNGLAARFSRDGRRLAITEAGLLGTLKVYDVAFSNVCRQFVSPDVIAGRRMKKGSWCAVVRPDGRLLAVVNYGSTELYDVTTARYLGSLPEGDGRTLAWTADGHELWVLNGNTLVRRQFEDQADGSIVTRRGTVTDLQGHFGYRLSLAEKADRWALSTLDGVVTGSISKTDLSYIPAPPEMPAKIDLNPLTISPDGHWAIVSPEGTDLIGILDLNQHRWPKVFHCDPTSFAAFSPDSRWCWIGTASEIWHVDMATLNVAQKIADRQEPGVYGQLDITADGKTLATLDGSSIQLRHGDTGAPFLRIRHPMPLGAAWISITPDGRYLTFSGQGHILQVWDLARLAREFRALGLPWRGPEFPHAAGNKAVSSLRIE